MPLRQLSAAGWRLCAERQERRPVCVDMLLDRCERLGALRLQQVSEPLLRAEPRYDRRLVLGGEHERVAAVDDLEERPEARVDGARMPSAVGRTALRECRSIPCAGAPMTARSAAPRLAAMATLAHPSAQFSATLRVHLANQPGAFAALANAAARHDALLDAIDLVRVENGTKVRDVTVLATDAEHIARIVDTVRELDGVFVEHVWDQTSLRHLGGKLEVVPKLPI